jgi:hypothetical protein
VGLIRGDSRGFLSGPLFVSVMDGSFSDTEVPVERKRLTVEQLKVEREERKRKRKPNAEAQSTPRRAENLGEVEG